MGLLGPQRAALPLRVARLHLKRAGNSEDLRKCNELLDQLVNEKGIKILACFDRLSRGDGDITRNEDLW